MRADSSMPKNLDATIICPVEEMGKNSVNPSIIPMIIA
jgi:hypothetical protein